MRHFNNFNLLESSGNQTNPWFDKHNRYCGFVYAVDFWLNRA